jgi:hypothetical protein
MTEPQADNQNHRPGLRSSAERHDQTSVPPTYTHLKQTGAAIQVSGMTATTNAVPLQTRVNAAPGTQRTTIHTPPGALVPSRMVVSAVNAASSNSPTPQTSSAGAKISRRCTITKAFSSSRINASIAVVALGVGAYYFYGQYIISYKTWELGLWKDCRDRAVRRNVRDNVQ